MKQKPLLIRGFGIYCSKSTSNNPKIIEVLYQKKNSNKYISLGNFKLSLSIGTQLLTTEETIFSDIEKIKFIIKETYGGNKVCINNIYLYEYLPSVDFTMSYQNFELNTEENITKINCENSKKLNIGDLSINDFTQDIIDNNNKNNDKDKNKDKIFSNNLPTRTTEILISESDLTEKIHKNKDNNMILSLDIKKNNDNNYTMKNKFFQNNEIKIKENSSKKSKERDKFNKYAKEEEKQAYTSFNENLLQKNKSINSKQKDNFNNSNIIFTTTDAKNFTTENNINENILNTISNISNINNNDKFNSFKINIKNKINEYDIRISNMENEVNNLKELLNAIFTNLNQIIFQNKNNYNQDEKEKEYNYIITECKNYIDNKMNDICETFDNNRKNYYIETQTQPYIYNQSYSINSNVIHPNLYNGSDFFYNDKNASIGAENILYKTNNTNASINIKACNNLRNKMNISNIMKKKFQKPQLTQLTNNNSTHKKMFSLKREKSHDVLTIKKNNLINKNLLKKNFKKKYKKEKEKEKEKDIEKILAKKLNKKLNNINEEIEDKIYKSILKPTLRELEKNLQNNFETIKEKLRSHSVNYSGPITKNTKSNRPINNKVETNIDDNKSDKNLLNKKNTNEEENNSSETENIKKNIVEKQHQLNELLLKLNNKQNKSFNNYISFRKDK